MVSEALGVMGHHVGHLLSNGLGKKFFALSLQPLCKFEGALISCWVPIRT